MQSIPCGIGCLWPYKLTRQSTAIAKSLKAGETTSGSAPGSPDSEYYTGLANSARSAEQSWRESDLPGSLQMLTRSGTRCSRHYLDYKREYGNCNIPDKWPENRKLSGWVGNQRQFRKRGVLTPSGIKRLKEIDFDWNIRNAAWDKMFAAISNYRREHGHCNILQNCPENP